MVGRLGRVSFGAEASGTIVLAGLRVDCFDIFLSRVILQY